MANNQYVNKVEFAGKTLMDVSGDTVTADKLMKGYTAHDKSGAPITGTAEAYVKDRTLYIPEGLVN